MRPQPLDRLDRLARRQAGSAYVIALLVLIVLTFMGMTLALTTQTEVQIGANERLANRAFYTAESGTAVALAHALVTADYDGRSFRMADSAADEPTGSPTGFVVGTEITVSPFLPILAAPCNLCQINQGSQYYRINHAVTSIAVRRGAVASGTDPIEGPPLGTPDPNPERTTARSTVSLQVTIQPMERQAVALITDPAKLALIRY
jgi:hypothetical protein